MTLQYFHAKRNFTSLLSTSTTQPYSYPLPRSVKFLPALARVISGILSFKANTSLIVCSLASSVTSGLNLTITYAFSRQSFVYLFFFSFATAYQYEQPSFLQKIIYKTKKTRLIQALKYLPNTHESQSRVHHCNEHLSSAPM